MDFNQCLKLISCQVFLPNCQKITWGHHGQGCLMHGGHLTPPVTPPCYFFLRTKIIFTIKCTPPPHPLPITSPTYPLPTTPPPQPSPPTPPTPPKSTQLNDLVCTNSQVGLKGKSFRDKSSFAKLDLVFIRLRLNCFQPFYV